MEHNFGNQEEFERNMRKLVSLLKKILRDHKINGQDLGQIFDKKNMNLNLCFFTFLPVGEEDLEEMESALEEYLGHDGERDDITADNFKFELNSRDIDFLKKYGIKF